MDEFEETRDLSKAAKETLAMMLISLQQDLRLRRWGYPQVRVRWMFYSEIIGLKFLEKSVQVVHWYRTTKKFLLDFNLSDINDLPNLNALRRKGLLSGYEDTL